VAGGGWQIGSTESRATNATLTAASATPQKSSGLLNLTDKVSNHSEPAVFSETNLGLMFTEKSGPLSSMPVGSTTTTAHVTNPILLAGESPNKTPIFISGVGDTRAFLACLRSSCPCDLTA